jgi:hypothetical protein
MSQNIEELKIYITNITIHTYTKFTQGSIANHRATYLGAYTTTLEASQKPMAISDPATANFTAIKTWETQVSHMNQGTRTAKYTMKY